MLQAPCLMYRQGACGFQRAAMGQFISAQRLGHGVQATEPLVLFLQIALGQNSCGGELVRRFIGVNPAQGQGGNEVGAAGTRLDIFGQVQGTAQGVAAELQGSPAFGAAAGETSGPGGPGAPSGS